MGAAGTRRTKLIIARKKAGFSQEALGEKLGGVTQVTVSHWENGIADPLPCNVGALCDILKVEPQDIDITIEGYNEDTMETTRREAITSFLAAAGIPFIIGDSGPMITSMPVFIAPEDFFAQCNVALKACWQLLTHSGFDVVQAVLNENVPTLTQLATTPSKYQSMAATLMVQVKILQEILAIHRMDLVGREIIAKSAVRFGELSGDPRMHAVALLEDGYSYVDRPVPMPGKAIPIFLEGLSLIGNGASLLQCDLYICLATACAQSGDEEEALKALEQGEAIFSEHPKFTSDLAWFYGDGFPEFFPQKSAVYLDLATHFPRNGYFQKAYDVLTLPGNNQVTSRAESRATINQADAARGLGDLDQFIALLERGLLLAIQIGSKKRVSEAIEVYQRIPQNWQREASVQRLRSDLLLPQGVV